MLLTAVACLIALVCVLVAWWSFVHVSAADRQALRKSQEMVKQLPSAASPEHAVFELNQMISEASREARVHKTVPASAARIALYSGALCAVLELTRTLSPSGRPALWPLVAFVVAAVAALLCTALGRSSDARSKRRRQAWDLIQKKLATHFKTEQGWTATRAPSKSCGSGGPA
ncbi:MAG TPA: hypothetical protein VGJ84_13645 [Polyangiaceae bacterium]